MDDPYGMGRSLDAIMGAMSPTRVAALDSKRREARMLAGKLMTVVKVLDDEGAAGLYVEDEYWSGIAGAIAAYDIHDASDELLKSAAERDAQACPDAAPDTDYAAQACEALRVASGVKGDEAIAALDAAIVAIAFYVPGEHDTSRTLRAMRAGLEGEKG